MLGVVMEALLEAGEQRREDGDKGGYEDGGDQDPDDEGMPLPGPEEARRIPWVVAGGGEEGPSMHREMASVEDLVASADEDEEEGDLERIAQVRGDLRRDQIEAEEGGGGEGEDGGGTEQGIDAEDDSHGDAPGESIRGGTVAE